MLTVCWFISRRFSSLRRSTKYLSSSNMRLVDLGVNCLHFESDPTAINIWNHKRLKRHRSWKSFWHFTANFSSSSYQIMTTTSFFGRNTWSTLSTSCFTQPELLSYSVALELDPGVVQGVVLGPALLDDVPGTSPLRSNTWELLPYSPCSRLRGLPYPLKQKQVRG